MEMDEAGKIVGVINLGFRLRHEFFDRAIREKWSGQQVIQRLEEGVFDPEFYAPYHLEIQQAFQDQFGIMISISKRSFLPKIFGERL
jgi:hypothetical protein